MEQNIFFFRNISKLFGVVFIPDKKYIKHFCGITWIQSWKPNGMLEESIEI